MAAAMGAFSDSTPTVGMETWAADERHSVPTPWASLPIIRPHRPLRSVAASESAGVVETAGMAANRLIPFGGGGARAGGEAMPRTKGTRKSEPAEARSVLGLWGLTEPLRNSTPVAPKASAVRTMAPAFPGS